MDLLLFELNKIYVEREKAIIKQMNVAIAIYMLEQI
jgi:hypothetical protein